MLSAQLEAQNINFQLDREQRKDHAIHLVAVLDKLADALGRIADKLQCSSKKSQHLSSEFSVHNNWSRIVYRYLDRQWFLSFTYSRKMMVTFLFWFDYIFWICRIFCYYCRLHWHVAAFILLFNVNSDYILRSTTSGSKYRT